MRLPSVSYAETLIQLSVIAQEFFSRNQRSQTFVKTNTCVSQNAPVGRVKSMTIMDILLSLLALTVKELCLY